MYFRSIIISVGLLHENELEKKCKKMWTRIPFLLLRKKLHKSFLYTFVKGPRKIAVNAEKEVRGTGKICPT